jgi:hypothetical protein
MKLQQQSFINSWLFNDILQCKNIPYTKIHPRHHDRVREKNKICIYMYIYFKKITQNDEREEKGTKKSLFKLNRDKG